MAVDGLIILFGIIEGVISLVGTIYSGLVIGAAGRAVPATTVVCYLTFAGDHLIKQVRSNAGL